MDLFSEGLETPNCLVDKEKRAPIKVGFFDVYGAIHKAAAIVPEFLFF
jgi:hypothetical protein